MKNKTIFSIQLLLLSAFTLVGQTNVFKEKVLDNTKQIPYGYLPFWHGDYPKYADILLLGHNLDSISYIDYNIIIENGMKNNPDGCCILNSANQRKCISLNGLKEKAPSCQMARFQTEDTTFSSDNHKHLNKRLFCSRVVKSANSVSESGFHIVYFAKTRVPLDLGYYSLVFDTNGNLVSTLLLSTFMVGENYYYPLHNEKNKKQSIWKIFLTTCYLPNKLLLQRYPEHMMGGGVYVLMMLDPEGHYRVLREWTERGQIEEDTITKSEIKNYPRYDGNDTTGKWYFTGFSKIIFKVNDPDGYSNIREKPENGSAVLRTIKNNDVVFGIYENDDWVKIEFTADKNGKIIEGGYIHISRLEKISDETNEFVELPSYEEWIREVNAVKKQ